jgi:hypothetical protein
MSVCKALVRGVFAGASLLPWPGVVIAQTPNKMNFIDANQVQAACAVATASSYATAQIGSRARRFGEFCALPNPGTSSAAWNAGTAPVPSEVLGVLQGNRPSDSSALVPAAGPVSLAAFGGAAIPDQGVILVGFSQFVVGRAKSEVATYMINRFADHLCPEALVIRWPKELGRPELREHVSTFIPATCTLLKSGSGDELLGSGYGLPSFGVLRTTLRSDLDGLPDVVITRFQKLGTIVYHGAFEPEADAGKRDAAQRLTALIGLGRLAMSFMKERDFPIAFREAANDMVVSAASLCDGTGTTGCSLDWRAITVVRNMVVAGTIAGAAPSAQLRKAIPLDSSLTLTLKALAVNLQVEAGAANSTFTRALTDFLREVNAYNAGTGIPFDATKVYGLARPFISALAAGHAEAERKASDAKIDRHQMLAIYADAFVTMAPELVRGLQPELSGDAANQITLIAKRIGSYPALRVNEQYSTLVADLMTLTSLVAGGVLYQELRQVTFPPAAIRTAQFVVDASQSKDADTFTAVLASYAAPATSFQRKRTRRPGTSGLYWSFNTYLGVAAGRETAEGTNIPTGNETATYRGFSIPVGLELGLSRHASGFGLLFQIADIGQVASWRSKQKESTDVKTTPPGLTFASVFAPGANLVWNMRSIPLALGTGYARAPQFRELTGTSDPSRPKADVWRWVVFLGVDVPIFP